MNEQFSAFLDNEATRDESDAVVNALLRDDKLRDSWTRQHWIREALRGAAGDPPVSLDAGFAGRVMQAARDEVVSGETALDWQPNPHANTTHPTVVTLSHPGQRRRRWRNMAGLAVAASAAGFALLATQPLQEMGMPMQATGSDGPAQPTRVASANVAATGFDTDTAATNLGGFGDFDMAGTLFSDLTQNVAARVAEPEASADHWAVSDPTLASRLNGYLVEHNGLARGYGLSVTSPGFVRVATYGASN